MQSNHHNEHQADSVAVVAERELDPESILSAFWLPPLYKRKAIHSLMRHLSMACNWFFSGNLLSWLLVGWLVVVGAQLAGGWLTGRQRVVVVPYLARRQPPTHPPTYLPTYLTPARHHPCP